MDVPVNRLDAHVWRRIYCVSTIEFGDLLNMLLDFGSLPDGLCFDSHGNLQIIQTSA